METIDLPPDDNWEHKFTFQAAVVRFIRRLRRRVRWYYVAGCGLLLGIGAGLLFAGWLIASAS
jgi:hypothetical protein